MTHLKIGDFYVFRRPLLPVGTLFKLLGESAAPEAVGASLKSILGEPGVGEALYLASPALYQQVQRWFSNEEGVAPRKLLLTLFKYVIRASTRSTPFGMFAGLTGTGRVGCRTRISFDEGRPYLTHSRLDLAFLDEVLQEITLDPPLREHLVYYPNNSIYTCGTCYRYTYCDKPSGQYSLCSVDASPYLKTILAAAGPGATVSRLVAAISSEEVTPEEARYFIHQLIEEQMLVDHLQLAVHGPEPVGKLAEQLAALPGGAHWAGRLDEARRVLAGTADQVEKGKKVREITAPGAPSAAQCPVQTNIFFNTTHNSIGRPAMAALEATLNRLVSLNQGVYMADLLHFKKKFTERYEGREVQLMKALDAETGIGYGRASNADKGHLPLLECLPSSRQTEKSDVEWNFWKEFLMDKYSDALLHGRPEIELSERDIAYLSEKTAVRNQSLPATCVAFGNLLAQSEEALDRGDFLFNLYSMSGPSTGNLLSRFCEGDPALHEQVQQFVQAEEQAHPDVIFAEIVHLPDARAGNILTRPALRKHQILYLTPGATPGVVTIPLSDLMISVDARGGVVLRSRSLGKRVIPRLTSAHDFSNGVNIYRFLCDLQYDQAVLNVTWHWSILEKRKYLPRVRYRNVILSRATWNLGAEEYREIQREETDLAASLNRLRLELKMPRYVALGNGDNEIMLDLEHPLCQEIFREEIGKKGQVTLREFLQLPQNCFLNDRAGKYVNEIIIPCGVPGAARLSGCTIPTSTANPGLERRFSLGSEWLYYKIYTGEKTADLLLRNVCKDLFEESLAAGHIDSWFFVRYADPEFHLRIRLHSARPDQAWPQLIPRIEAAFAPYLQKELVLKVQTDTYVREIERYGDHTMLASEELFFHDSFAVLSWLQRISGDRDEHTRWQFGLCGIDALLNDFNYPLERKVALLQGLSSNYEAKYQLTPEQRKHFNLQYRHELPNIREALQGYLEATSGKAILEQRSRNNANAILAIKAFNHDGFAGLDKPVTNYLHMFLNRLFISDPRQHELILYFFLSKYYTSQAALLKKEPAARPTPVDSSSFLAT